MVRNGYTNRFLSFTMMLLLLVSTLAFLKLVSPVQANPDPIEGWAVIIVGDYRDDPFTGPFINIYNALLDSGFTDRTIYHLDIVQTRGGHDRDSPEPNETLTNETIKDALTGWLGGRSDKNDLSVVAILAHGDIDVDCFRLLYAPSNSSVVLFSDISQWLTDVSYGRVMLVVDASYSEYCIDDLSATDRIIISSAANDQPIATGTFSNYFWPKTVDMNIMEAFNNASYEAWNHTLTHSETNQTARLDDNGDGVGNWKPDDPLPLGGDGYLANVTYLNKNNMADLVVEAKGIKAAGGVETLTDVDVTINQHIDRNATMNILLAKGDYTIEVPNSTVINGTTWYFRDWENGSTDISRDLTLSADKTITARYVDSFHDLTISVVPDSKGNTTPAPGTYSHLHGVNVTVNAIENTSHYEFDHWVLDGETAGSNLEIMVFMNTSHTLEAHFSWYNNPPGSPTLTGPSNGDVYETLYFQASSNDPESDDILYYFDWGDDSSTTTGWVDSGTEVERSHSWSSAAAYVVRVKAKDTHGAWSGWTGKVVNIGGECPYVYTWNGSAYVLDNNVLGMSEVSNGSDVEDLYKLEQEMVPLRAGEYASTYSVMLGEFENEHSYIDTVKLYAVNHDSNVSVALTPDGQILTYSDPSPPVSAVDNYGIEWLSSVSSTDDTYYLGFPEDYLLVDFGNLDISQGAKLVLRANYGWKKDVCIHVQVLNGAGGWTDAAVLRTRNHWTTIIVDLADHLPNPDGTIRIRLYLTGLHRIDYIGLDTTLQADITVIQRAAVRATHSTHGRVTLKLLLNDQVYAELLPGEQIELKFILPNNTEGARTFMIYVEGRYETI